MGIRQQQRLMFTLCNFDSRDDVPGPVHAAAGSTGVQSYHVGVHLFSRTHRDHTRSPHERKVLLSTKCEYILACVTISTSICSELQTASKSSENAICVITITKVAATVG